MSGLLSVARGVPVADDAVVDGIEPQVGHHDGVVGDDEDPTTVGRQHVVVGLLGVRAVQDGPLDGVEMDGVFVVSMAVPIVPGEAPDLLKVNRPRLNESGQEFVKKMFVVALIPRPSLLATYKENSDLFLAGAGFYFLISLVLSLILARLQAARLAARENLNQILNNAGEGIYGLDLEGYTTFANKAAEEILGYSFEEMQNTPQHDLIHHHYPDGKKYPRKDCGIYSVLQEGGTRKDKNEVFWHKDGHAIPVEYTSAAIAEPSGKPTGAVVVFRDVTEERKIQEEKETLFSNLLASERDLKERQLYLNTVQDTMVDGLVVISEKGTIRSVNKATLNIFGYSETELVGKNIKMLMKGEVHDSHDQYLANHVETGKGNIIGIGPREVEGYNKSGQKVDLELAVNKATVDGQLSFVGSLRDITTRKSAEKKMLQYASIIENSINEVYFIDSETFRIIDTNKSARDNLGYEAHEMNKMTVLDVKPEFSRKSFSKLVAPLKKGKLGRVRLETKHLRKDGTTYDVGVTLQLSSLEEKPIIVAMLEDITIEKVAAEQLRRAQKMESIGNLAGGIAHDFNNLLTAIQGGLQLLEMSQPNMSEEDREFLDLAKKASIRGADLTHRLLAFSRNQPLHAKSVEINKLITEALPLLKQSMTELIEVKFHPGKKDAFVNIDASELDNALLNIAINAAGAMPKGGAFTIEVGSKRITRKISNGKSIKPGNYVFIALSDTGCGMTRETLDKVFEPFFTTKEVGKGTGLGLSMVYGFVKQSGGYVTVYSEPNQGTTFNIYLPEIKAVHEIEEQAKTFEIPINKEQGVILLVEDDKEVMHYVATALKTRGYNVLEALDGERAIKLMDETDKIDLLLSDVILPKGTLGPELGREFKKKFPNSTVLYTSGYTGKAIKDKGFDLSKEDLLTKPYNLEDLFQRVREKMNFE